MKPRIIYNSCCEACRICLPNMTMVGAVAFCEPCFNHIFTSENPVKDESNIYYKWLDHQKKRIENKFKITEEK